MLLHMFMNVVDAGYTIFVVEGDLPPCEADQLLTLVPIQADKHASKKKPSESGGHHSKSTAGPLREKQKSSTSDDDAFALELATALSASMMTHTTVKGQEDEFDLTMATALSESLQGECTGTCSWHNNNNNNIVDSIYRRSGNFHC